MTKQDDRTPEQRETHPMIETNYAADIPESLAVSAFNGVSFSPERRGASTRSEYAQTMQEDKAEFYRHAAKSGTEHLVESEFERYRAGYAKRYRAYLASSSRCVSSFIVGPSNFPVRRMQKRNDVAHKRLTELLDFRKRAMAAIIRTLRPELRPIMSGDGDAVQRLQEKIDEAERLQATMKAMNAAHKRFLKDSGSLDKSDLPEELKAKIRNYKPAYSWEPHPFAPWQLTNNNANIRRMKERLEQISRNQSAEETVAEGSNARFEDCPADNRVRLFFPGKPDAETRGRLKSSGFRWSPTIGCWQAYRNHGTIETAKREAAIENTECAIV